MQGLKYSFGSSVMLSKVKDLEEILSVSKAEWELQIDMRHFRHQIQEALRRFFTLNGYTSSDYLWPKRDDFGAPRVFIHRHNHRPWLEKMVIMHTGHQDRVLEAYEEDECPICERCDVGKPSEAAHGAPGNAYLPHTNETNGAIEPSKRKTDADEEQPQERKRWKKGKEKEDVAETFRSSAQNADIHAVEPAAQR